MLLIIPRMQRFTTQNFCPQNFRLWHALPTKRPPLFRTETFFGHFLVHNFRPLTHSHACYVIKSSFKILLRKKIKEPSAPPARYARVSMPSGPLTGPYFAHKRGPQRGPKWHVWMGSFGGPCDSRVRALMHPHQTKPKHRVSVRGPRNYYHGDGVTHVVSCEQRKRDTPLQGCPTLIGLSL